MKKIIFSLTAIAAVAAIVVGGTTAFFSDSETSTGNTFTAGAIDLLIDNVSYVTDNSGELVRSIDTSWRLDNLTDELFFDFDDLKPGDEGEDTISIHVNNNDAWVCMDINITDALENNLNETEEEAGDTTSDEGELQNELYFAFWADDGDNVYESGEQVFRQGTAAELFDGTSWSLADSQNNVWEETGPIPGGETVYIAKDWCFGSMTEGDISQDQEGYTGSNGPLDRGTGWNCDGSQVGNQSQTDGILANVSFYAVQSRNNDGFTCDSLNQPEISVNEGAVDFDEYAGARYRSFGNTGGEEVYAGEEDLGVPGNRSASHYSWTSPGSHDVEVSYDSTLNEVTAKVGDSTSITHTAGLTCTADKMQISVVARDTGSVVELNNVDLNGNSLGDFSATATAWNTWNVSGFDFSSDFTLTGDLELTGTFGTSQELSKVQIDFGCES